MLSLVVVGCDTGDGKTLRPVDPDTTTTSTVPATVDTAALPSLPLEDAGLGSAPPVADSGLQLYAPWQEGSPIDARYTCDGEDLSPALSWAAPPPGTVELAIALVDDSVAPEGNPFVHWVIAGIDPAGISLVEGEVPAGALQATNSLGNVGWDGPCPPSGDPAHTYRLTMYALNQQSELADGTPADEMIGYLEAITIGSTDLTGTFQRL